MINLSLLSFSAVILLMFCLWVYVVDFKMSMHLFMSQSPRIKEKKKRTVDKFPLGNIFRKIIMTSDFGIAFHPLCVLNYDFDAYIELFVVCTYYIFDLPLILLIVEVTQLCLIFCNDDRFSLCFTISYVIITIIQYS
jgi:hypothetical protein